MRALTYLQLRSFVNSMKLTLKSPKRLIPTILIGLWIFQAVGTNLVLGMTRGFGRRGPSSYEFLSGAPVDAIWAGVFALLAVITLYTIYSAFSEGLLIFSPQHIDFLFPSPVSRRSVLIWKLIGDYGKYLLYCGFFFLIVITPVYMSLDGLRGLLWGVFSWLAAFFLLILATSLCHTLNIVTTYGVGRIRTATRIAKLAALAIVMIVVVSAAFHYWKTGDALNSGVAAVHAGVVRFILIPISWCTTVIVGPMMGITALGAAIRVMLLGLLATVSTATLLARPENFYEPSLGISAKMAKLRALGKSGDLAAIRMEAKRQKGNLRYTGSPIPPFGRGAAALIWKSMVVRLRTSKSGFIGLAVILPIAAAVAGYAVRDAEVQAYSPFAMVYMIWIFVTVAQHELRSEFRQADIIKAMPVSGFRVVAAQVFSQWLLIVAFTIIGALSVLAFLRFANSYFLAAATVTSIIAGFTSTAASTIPALLYPDARDKLQQMIPAWLTMLLLFVALAPSVGLMALLIWLKAPIVLMIAAMLGLNAPISLGALAIAGRQFEKFDPTDG